MRFKGSHDASAIAKHLNDAHQRFGLSTRNIIYTVTDNAANIAKSFKQFGIGFEVDFEIENANAEVVDSDENDDEDEVNITSVHDVSSNINEDIDSDIHLPIHVRCAAHTLNLVVSADIQKAITRKTLKVPSMYRTALARCSQHWNLLNRSANKAGESCIKKFGKLIRLPCVTRWNSLFDALEDISLLDPIILREFSSENKLQTFTDEHIAFIKEYVECLRPIALALDKLQGDKNVWMADLIPSVMNAYYMLQKQRNRTDIMY